VASIERAVAAAKAAQLCTSLQQCIRSYDSGRSEDTARREDLEQVRRLVCHAAALSDASWPARACRSSLPPGTDRLLRPRHMACDTEIIPDAVRNLAPKPNGIRALLPSAISVPLFWYLPWKRWLRTEKAWLFLHAADEMFVGLAPDRIVRARLADILVRAQHVLEPDDPQLKDMRALYERHTVGYRPGPCQPACSGYSNDRAEVMLTEVERRTLAAVLHTAYGVSDRGYVRAHTFRNILVTGTLLLTLAAAILLLVGARWPNALPLCTTTAAKAEICPTAPRGVERGGDVLLIALFGAVGAGVSAIGAISNLRHLVDPYGTPIWQGLLKVPIGAIAAVIGVLAVEGGLEPSAGVVNSQGGLLLLAFVFGYSQQILTRIVDNRGSEVREGLTGERTGRDSSYPSSP
jgi:hypothetical protein